MSWIIFTIILLFTFAFGLFFGAYFSPMAKGKKEASQSLKEKISAKYFKKAAYSPSKDIENQIFHVNKTYSYFDDHDPKRPL